MRSDRQDIGTMATVKVKFIDEGKILRVQATPSQNPFETLGCGINSLLKERKTLSNVLPPIQDEDMEAQESEMYSKPTELIENENDNLKFGFQTPNKHGNMLEKVDSALQSRSTGGSRLLNTPRTPKENKIPRSPRTPTTPKTPKTPSGRTSRVSTSGYRTPKSKYSSISSTPSRSSRNTCTRDVPNTPYSLRKTIKKRIANVLNDDSDEDYDDSDNDKTYPVPDSEDESITDDTEDEFIPCDDKLKKDRRKSNLKFSCKDVRQTILRTPRRGRELKVDVDMVASTDEYFEHNSESNACRTSDHTLNRLEKPRLGPEVLKSILEDRADHHKKQRQELIEDYTTLFPHWMTLLCEGFSLFLCGVGSKKSLLLLFQEEMLCDFDHLVVNGFFPSLTIKSILISILEEILELVSYPLNIVDQLKVIADHYSDSDISPLFLIINNLDGPMLRNEKAQHSLSQLASCKNIHIIASLDHINSPLIFDGNKYSFYNPLWWDTTTLAPYTEETSFENSLLVQQSGGLALSSLLHVFKSLTPNAKGIFILLAKYQLNEKSSSSTYIGMSFGDMYQRCRESFLVNSDLTLRAQLTEFKDHKLIKFRRGYDGSENLLIPLEDSTLQEFLNQYEES